MLVLILIGIVLLVLSLFWTKSYEVEAEVVGKEYVSAKENYFAEYDAYILGDDSLLFSYYPEKFLLLLHADGNDYVIPVDEEEYRKAKKGESVPVRFRQMVVYRFKWISEILFR